MTAIAYGYIKLAFTGKFCFDLAMNGFLYGSGGV